MPKETNSERLQDRAAHVKQEINKYDAEGYRLDAAIKKVAKTLFLSEATVYKDYYK